MLIAFEGAFIVAGLIAFYIWQTRSLKRDQEITQKKMEEEARAKAEPPPASSPPDAGA